MVANTLDSSNLLRFDRFRLRRDGGGLLRENALGMLEPISVGSRALEVLGVLVRYHGELVLKDDIMRAVWPETSVEEHNLTVQIAALRRVLDVGRADGSCIQTVVGRGYRFLPVVTPQATVPPETDQPLAEDKPFFPVAENKAKRGFRPTAAACAIILVVILAAGGAWMLHGHDKRRPSAYSPQDRRLSIMVLPFENVSDEPAQGDIAAGITAEVRTDIVAQYPDDPLVSAPSVAAYNRGKAVDLRAIKHDQDVHFVLAGNASRVDGHLIVAVTLYQIEDERAVWSRRYDQPDRPDAWKVVVQSVVANTHSKMTDLEAARAMREHPDDLDKRDLNLAANSGSWAQVSKEKFLERAALADRALVLDPNYVPALATDATVRAYLVLGGHSLDPGSDLARAAKEADRALMLAPDLFWVLVAKASVLRAQGDLAAAAALIRRTIELRPAWAARYKDLGRVLLPLGQVREALENFRIAKRLALGIEPVQVDDANIAVALLANEQFPEAIAQARLAIAEFAAGSGRDAEIPWLTLIAAESQNEQVTEARADLKTFLGISRTFGTMADFNKFPHWAASTQLLEGLRRAGMPEQ